MAIPRPMTCCLLFTSPLFDNAEHEVSSEYAFNQHNTSVIIGMTVKIVEFLLPYGVKYGIQAWVITIIFITISFPVYLYPRDMLQHHIFCLHNKRSAGEITGDHHTSWSHNEA